MALKTALALPPSNHQSLINVNTCVVTNMIEKNHSTKIFIFASVLRCDPKSRPVMWRVKAASEKEARRQLVRDYVLSLAGCLPDSEVYHA